MAAFTSKATGNWSAGGQTTWNEAGVPGMGDNVTVQSPHTVTVDITLSAGDASDLALSINSGGTLTVADNVTLWLSGSIDNAGNINIGDGSAIEFLPLPTTLIIQWQGVDVH